MLETVYRHGVHARKRRRARYNASSPTGVVEVEKLLPFRPVRMSPYTKQGNARKGDQCKVRFAEIFSDLGVLHHADLCRSQHPAVELEALLLRVEAAAVLLVRLGCLEDGLVDIGVELLAGL